MANTFKNALVKNAGTAGSTIYVPPAGKKSIIIELDVANTYTSSVLIDVYINSGGQDYYVVKGAPVPYGSSLQVISGQKIVLEDGDTIKAKSSVNSSIDIVASILEDI